MANRNVKSEKDSAVQDKLQVILGRLLQDDDNKYCVDCDSKGPRWSSWNLGIFVCIRCAGIHRNLGVHISKVRSVNLDSWTPQQVASVQLMGNSRARAVYEANLPEDFKRPTTDAQVEVFIRAKYEKKKYIAREWIPAKVPDYPIGWNELVEAEKQKKDIRSVALPPITAVASTSIATSNKSALSNSAVLASQQSSPQASLPKKVILPKETTDNSLSKELFSLTVEDVKPVPRSNSHQSFSSDLLGLDSTALDSNSASDFDFFGLSQPAKTTLPLSDVNSTRDLSVGSRGGDEAVGIDSSKMSKDSILALFNKPTTTNFQQQPVQQIPSGFPNDFGPFQSIARFNNTSGVQSPSSVFGQPNSFSAINNPFLNQMPGTQHPQGFQQNKNPNFAGLNGFNFP